MKCKTKDCKNKARKKGLDCEMCHKRKVRGNNLIKYAYDTLKINAKRRGKIFTISYVYFEKLCLESNYHELKGRGANDLTIDRINNEIGYVEGNVRVVKKSINSTKQDKDLPFYCEETECPF